VNGGPGLIRSSSSTDLRASHDQEDHQNLVWLKDEVRRLSAYERECQQKDAVIEQMRHQLEESYQQHGSSASRLTHGVEDSGDGVDIAQRLRQLEREVIMKRAEVEELRKQIGDTRSDNDRRRSHSSTVSEGLVEVSHLQAEVHRLNMLLAQSHQTVAEKDTELGRIRQEMEGLHQALHNKDAELLHTNDDLHTKDNQIEALRQKLQTAEVEIEAQKNTVSHLKEAMDETQQNTAAEKDALEKLRVQLEVSELNNQELHCTNTKLHDELTRLANKLEDFRHKVKQATCFASDIRNSPDCDDDADVVEVLKQVVSDRAKCRAKVQKLTEELAEAQRVADSIRQTKHLMNECLTSLASSGYFSRELKLEIAALHRSVHDNENGSTDIKSLFIRTLEGHLTWQEQIELALMDCGIDVVRSTDAPGHHIRDLHSQLMHVRQELSRVLSSIDETARHKEQELTEALEAQKHRLQDEFSARIDRLTTEHEEQLHLTVNEREMAVAAKHEEHDAANRAKIAQLEMEVDHLKQSLLLKDDAESHLKLQLADASRTVDTLQHAEVELKRKVHELEHELTIASQKYQRELSDMTRRHSDETAQHKEQIHQHSLTICALEESLDKATNKVKEYQSEMTTYNSEIAKLQSTITELSSKASQHQPTSPVRPRMIIQSAQSPLDATAMSQLQRDNVELKRQMHEQADVILALRHELTGARAKLSDITGEVSETQKRELEHFQEVVKHQEAELTELRQQLAKLSEIVDRQTNEINHLNTEASKHKAALTKYKNKLNEKEAQLKKTEEGLHKVKHESSTKLTAIEDEGRLSSELALCGAKCRGERHEQVIARQRDALIELRAKIKVLDMGNTSPLTHDQAIQEVLVLRQQLAELQIRAAVPSSLSYGQSQLLGLDIPQPSTLNDLSETLEISENLYLSLIRAVTTVLELESTGTMLSLAHAPHDDQHRIAAQREQECERVTSELRKLKERIERKDELLQGYEHDLAKLRRAEDLTQLTCSEKENLLMELRSKCEEIENLRARLARKTEECNSEKLLNSRIKKKEFLVHKEVVDRGGKGWPKHSCVPEDPTTESKKRNEREKLKRKEYEVKMLQDKLRAMNAGHAQRRTHSIDSGRGISSD
jgi:chromosome segregation ATPase